jgi:serine/threonine protein kinase
VLGEDIPALLAGLRVGSVVAGYRLEAQVGAGGMAVVFRARDERLGRLVALKVLAPGLAADPAFRRRFIAESRAAATVDDPHIIPIYEAGEAGGVLFIAMRFVGGGDLRGVLDRAGVLPPAWAAAFISPVASALDAAHRAGLVHRDVKPANILVDARRDRPDHVYLSDFGVSKGAISSVSLTGAGHFLGTPDYSAPEQIQGREVDGRADQYALACVAYQLLTGVVPFARDQGMSVLFAHLSEPPPALAARRPGLPAAADAVLARGMAKVPEKRYASCTGFADALRQALGLAPYTDPGPLPVALGHLPVTDHPRSWVTAPPSIVTSPGSSGSAATSTADLVPGGAGTPAPTGPGHARGRTRAPGSHWRRRAPLAAAAAVVVAVAAVLLALGYPKAGPGLRPRTSPTDKATRLTYALGGRVPPYYVWLGSQGNSNFSPSYAVVRLTATGAVLGTVTASAPGGTVVAVTGAADDRTFVLEEQPYDNNNSGAGQYFEPRTFYLLRLAADGRPAGVTRLAITEPSGSGANGLALSPDGTKLAIGFQPDNVKSEPDLTELQLYSVATGALLRSWQANGTIGLSGEDSEALSWTSDGKTLAFSWWGNGSGSETGELLLDISKGGTSLIGDSREALSFSNSSCQEDRIVTPDGSAIVCGAGNNSGSAFQEFSTATGQPTRTLAQWTTGQGQVEVIWSNPSGSVLVGTAPNGDVGMITAGTFTAFHGPVSETYEDQGAW